MANVNNVDITLNGEVAVELLEPEELLNHKWLLEAANQKSINSGT